MNDFERAEKVIFWAINYADGIVIVIADRKWIPSDQLAQFVREKKVKIHTVPLSRLSPRLIRRLKYSYMISTSLKKHSDMEKIVRRFTA